MSNETILTDERIFALAAETDIASIDPKIDVLMFSRDEMLKSGRDIEQAVLQSPEIQELRDLLKDARQQLPLAAQFWNEDDEPERGSRNVQRVMELIARIDAAMEKQP